MSLINWLWLEDLLVRSAEDELAYRSESLMAEEFYAFCLEFDVLDAGIAFSLGTREDVERAAAEASELTCYRALELSPGYWRHARLPIEDPSGSWQQASRILDRLRDTLGGFGAPAEVVEFHLLRFEYLAESVVQRLVEGGAFRRLRRTPDFIAFAAGPQERLEDIEDRLCKLYPNYNRATAEWAEHARPADIQAELAELFENPDLVASTEVRRGMLRRRSCQSGKCGRHPVPRSTQRCTYCQRWFCNRCQVTHVHPELAEPQPLFVI
jgi:hypothetical protein